MFILLFFCTADYKQQNNNESPPAYADGIILGQTKLVLNLNILDTLYSIVSLPHLRQI